MKAALHNNDINTLDDLQAEIKQVRKRIKAKEQDLAQRWDKLPEETLKAATGLILPAFINNKIAGGTYKLVQGILGFILPSSSSKKKDSWQDSLAAPAKQLGLFAVAKLVFNLFKK